MFRLPSAWNIHQSSSGDECEFGSCDNDLDSEGISKCNSRKENPVSADPARNVNLSTTIQKKRPSSDLEATLDDSDIETSPRPQVNHQNRPTQYAVSRPLPSAASMKPAHVSSSSIEEIETDSPTPVDVPLLPKRNIHNSSSGNAIGWVKLIPDSVFQQHAVNPRGGRARPNSRTADSVLLRQSYTAMQRNKDSLNTTSHLLHSQTLNASHVRELILLSVVASEPCHLPVFPVRVNFCHRKSSNLLPPQNWIWLALTTAFAGMITCYVPIASAKSLGEMNPGDFLIVGQPWRAVGSMDERTNSLAISIFCSELILKCPSVRIGESASARTYVESLPFMSYSAFANFVVNPLTRYRKESSCEQHHIHAPPLCLSEPMCCSKHSHIGREAVVQATASVIDHTSGICTKDLMFAVPVAIVTFRDDSCATLCYCPIRDFEIIVQLLKENCSYVLKVIREEHSDPRGSHFRALINTSSVQPAICLERNDSVENTLCEASRIRLQLQYHHHFSFHSPVDHVLVPENGHGFGRFSFLDTPVYGCIICSTCTGSLTPIFMMSRSVADFIFGLLLRRHGNALDHSWIIFERLKVVSSNFNEDSPYVVIADGFTKLSACTRSTLDLKATCPSSTFRLLSCHSSHVVVVDSLYNGGDHMCPKCQSSCVVIHSDSLCRRCGFCGPSKHLASGYLPLYLLVTNLDCSSTSTQVLQIRSSALSSFVAQYMHHYGHDAEKNLKDPLLFHRSLNGKKLHCCTLSHASLDESILMCERRPTWISNISAENVVNEVLQIRIADDET